MQFVDQVVAGSNNPTFPLSLLKFVLSISHISPQHIIFELSGNDYVDESGEIGANSSDAKDVRHSLG